MLGYPRKHSYLSLFEGLRGVQVCNSSICTVDKEFGLIYRGYPVIELCKKCDYEDVACLIINSELPKASDKKDFLRMVNSFRTISPEMKKLLQNIPKSAHPMDVLRTSVSHMSYTGPSINNCDIVQYVASLLGSIPSILGYWNAHSTGKSNTNVVDDRCSIPYHFLTQFSRNPSQFEVDALNKAMICYAENDINSSTLAARMTASTGGDYHSSIVAAISCLKGGRHGGANELALKDIKMASCLGVHDFVKLSNNVKRRINGFGNRIYRDGDPRAALMHALLKQLDLDNSTIVSTAESLESVMAKRSIKPNVDFYASVIFYMLNVPSVFNTPIFALSRCVGWSAHIAEQNQHRTIIQSSSRYTGPPVRHL